MPQALRSVQVGMKMEIKNFEIKKGVIYTVKDSVIDFDDEVYI